MSLLKVPVSIEDHIQGDLGAECMLVEYGDYECSSCGELQPTVKALRMHFGTLLSFVFRKFPLNEIHPDAEASAEAAEFAATQGKFWEMHDLLFDYRDNLNARTLDLLAPRIGLDDLELSDAVFRKSYNARILVDLLGHPQRRERDAYLLHQYSSVRWPA